MVEGEGPYPASDFSARDSRFFPGTVLREMNAILSQRFDQPANRIAGHGPGLPQSLSLRGDSEDRNRGDIPALRRALKQRGVAINFPGQWPSLSSACGAKKELSTVPMSIYQHSRSGAVGPGI
jgi:hypothetical protein